MSDLEKQFFAQRDNLETQFFTEAPKETTKRGANLGGALRNIAQATPFVGTYADEAEALLRSSNVLPEALSMATGVPSSITTALLPKSKEKLDYETL